MKFALLIFEDQSVFGVDKTNSASLEHRADHMAFREELGGAAVGGAGLKDPSTGATVRTSAASGKTVHDGPFAETKEQLGGFYLIEAPDLEAAVAIARRVPIYREGAVEVRQLLGTE